MTSSSQLPKDVERPIPMLLFCPRCHLQHIDAPDERTPAWTNPPHKSHLCHGCGCIWRPADVPTEGVAAIQTRGKNDTALEAMGASIPVGWQPIETAPKDGRSILAIWQYDPGDHEKGSQTHEVVCWCGWWDSNGFTQPEPTHWQPLPEPPLTTGGDTVKR